MHHPDIKIINNRLEVLDMPHNLDICDECFHHMASIDAPAACFWSYLCALYNNLHALQPNGLSQFDERITILEKQGYILTTELNIKKLGIVLLGLDAENQIICLNKNEHRHE